MSGRSLSKGAHRHEKCATGRGARASVMLVDEKGDLCTATALAPDLVLIAARCVARKVKRAVKVYQTSETIAVTRTASHRAPIS